MAECQLPKLNVAGSIPVSRSNPFQNTRFHQASCRICSGHPYPATFEELNRPGGTRGPGTPVHSEDRGADQGDGERAAIDVYAPGFVLREEVHGGPDEAAGRLTPGAYSRRASPPLLI